MNGIEIKSFQNIMAHGSVPSVERNRINRASGEMHITPKSVIASPVTLSVIVAFVVACFCTAVLESQLALVACRRSNEFYLLKTGDRIEW